PGGFSMFHRLRRWFTVAEGVQSYPGHMMVLILRGVFGAVVIGIATALLYYFAYRDQLFQGIISFFAIVLIGVAHVCFDVPANNKQIRAISAIYVGLMLGFFLGSLLWMALEPILVTTLVLDARVVQWGRLLVTVVTCYITVSLLVQTKDEFRFIIPYVEFSKQVKGPRSLVLDTSVIIDGRIADICDTGIIDTKLIVPRFVLQELQAIADSADKIKRNRGRRGLDVLKRMQTNQKVDLQVHEANLPELREVHKVDE